MYWLWSWIESCDFTKACVPFKVMMPIDAMICDVMFCFGGSSSDSGVFLLVSI